MNVIFDIEQLHYSLEFNDGIIKIADSVMQKNKCNEPFFDLFEELIPELELFSLSPEIEIPENILIASSKFISMETTIVDPLLEFLFLNTDKFKAKAIYKYTKKELSTLLKYDDDGSYLIDNIYTIKTEDELKETTIEYYLDNLYDIEEEVEDFLQYHKLNALVPAIKWPDFFKHLEEAYGYTKNEYDLIKIFHNLNKNNDIQLNNFIKLLAVFIIPDIFANLVFDNSNNVLEYLETFNFINIAEISLIKVCNQTLSDFLNYNKKIYLMEI